MIMLEGVLVDLVPYGAQFEAQEHTWLNSDAVFFWSMGGRWLVSQADLEHDRTEERENTRARQRVRFGVQTKDGTPIGLFGLNRVHPHHRLAMLTALIGDAAYWGGGYGTDALLLVIDYAFDWLDMRKLWIMTMSLNPRVIRQMEKVGFTQEGRQREATWANNGWADALVYGLQRSDWSGRAAVIARLGLEMRS